MLSHRAMYYGMMKALPGVSVVSEEHDPAPFDREDMDTSHKSSVNTSGKLLGFDVMIDMFFLTLVFETS